MSSFADAQTRDANAKLFHNSMRAGKSQLQKGLKRGQRPVLLFQRPAVIGW
jgi:hypothetical protein